MILKEKKILVQYSGGKDSTACLIKLVEDGAYVEAVHFIHQYGYSLPTEEAKRICDDYDVKLHIIDVTKELKELFLNDFEKRPCRFCKGIMDKKTVELAVKGGFDYICVGDTASDRTLVNRIKEVQTDNLILSRYFNKAVELPQNIMIIRPLIEFDNEAVFRYLDEHSVHIRRNNDTGDKYFEYSREGCPLQFKDYGVCYSEALMERLKTGNTLCSEYATSRGIKASIHLPSEMIVTIPKGYEEDCREYLLEKGFKLTRKCEIESAMHIYSFTIVIYKEICNLDFLDELFERLFERLSIKKYTVNTAYNHLEIKAALMSIYCNLIESESKVIGNIITIENLNIVHIQSLFVELFHTYDFSLNEQVNTIQVQINPILHSVNNCRTMACGKFGYSILRSGCLDDISESDIGFLRANGISTIIDLRNERQCGTDKIKIFRDNGMEYLRIPFIGDSPADVNKSNDVRSVVDSYLAILNQYDVMKKIFEEIGNAPGGVIVFCKYGKDRTGIIAMIMGLLCDIPYEMVIRDYALSELYLHPEDYDSDAYKKMNEIAKTFIRRFCDKYDSAKSYIEMVGVKLTQVKKIQKKLEMM